MQKKLPKEPEICGVGHTISVKKWKSYPMILSWMLPHLSTGTRGCSCRVDLLEVVETDLFKL